MGPSKPSFHELLLSVPKGKRTDRVSVSLALWLLGAIAPNSGVEVGVIRNLLREQLKRDAPTNPDRVLARGVPFIERKRVGERLTWRLTQSGLAWLIATTGGNVSHEVELARGGYIGNADVAVLCALDRPELAALKASFGGQHRWRTIDRKDLTHIFAESEIRTKAGLSLRIVATTCTSMGLTGAAIASTHLVLGFRPRLLVMTGIAAGTRDGALGDILVADPSVDYASGKVALRDGVREFQPDPYPIPLDARLRNLLRDSSRMEILLEAVRLHWSGDHPSPRLNLHVGPLGAADQVINDPTKIPEIRKNWRKLVGIEMEAYAVYRAAHEAPQPKPLFLACKSVCDFADKKADNWQGYAAYTASEFLYCLLVSEWEEMMKRE